MVKTKRSNTAASNHGIINPHFEFQSMKEQKSSNSLGALEPGGVENLPTKDEVLVKDPKIGD